MNSAVLSSGSEEEKKGSDEEGESAKPTAPPVKEAPKAVEKEDVSSVVSFPFHQ